MNAYDRNATARRHLDARVNSLTSLGSLDRPPRGWIKAIRNALGMTTEQLARRLGTTQSAVVILEQSEAAYKIRLNSLLKAAEALDCRLVYALVPNRPLESMVRERARQIAADHFHAVQHTMTLEDQAVEDPSAHDREIESMLPQIDPRSLWDKS